MHARILKLIALPLVAGAVALTIFASGANAHTETRGAYAALLSGGTEVPGPGDPDGFGYSLVTLDAERGEVCAAIFAAHIGTATAAHIHRGPVGGEGPVVVPFTALPTEESPIVSSCTTDVERDLIERILANPGNYYVNVHNAEFAKGAIRGQLQ
ncbi:MAG: CHRD domain-containing protein [Dehalococcoidia bacterium]